MWGEIGQEREEEDSRPVTKHEDEERPFYLVMRFLQIQLQGSAEDGSQMGGGHEQSW